MIQDRVIGHDHKGTALLIVDMQNDFCLPEGKLARSGVDVSAIHAIIPRIARLIEAARTGGVPVVHIAVVQPSNLAEISPSFLQLLRTTSPLAPFGVEGTWGAEIVADLAPRPGEPLIVKRRSGAFTKSSLDDRLRQLGAERLIVAGEQTPGCIEATVRQAADLDYFPVLATDCVVAFDRELHDAALKVMTARWESATSAELIQAWGEGGARG